MRLILRVEVNEAQAQALVDEWLHGSGYLNISTGDSDADMEVPLTYVKEA